MLASQWPSPEAYGEQWAHDYDDLDGALISPEMTVASVAALARLANGGVVREVAAGTGRVAIPLARAGVDVIATDASSAMLARLRSKDSLGLVRTEVEVLPSVGGADHHVVAILANSIWALRSAGDQQSFLRNAAAVLAPGGVVVVEVSASVDPTRWSEPSEIQYPTLAATRTTVFDPETQQTHHRYHFPEPVEPAGRDVYMRLLTADQLLAMATAEGLTPRHLWSDWHGERFADRKILIAVLQRDGDS